MKRIELQGDEKTAALKASALDIVIAGEWKKGVNYCNAAHAQSHTIFVLVLEDGETVVWKLEGGTKAERRAIMKSVRDKFGIK